jgi:SAM-dependent methyltransferase
MAATITPMRSPNGHVATPRKLDIGSGAIKDEGYETMDISPVYSPDFQHDLTQFPWPFEDESFDEVRAFHVLEHIERQHLIAVMNEMHRLVTPDGIANIEVPVFPFWTAIADPTHVSFFVPQTWAYFCTHESVRRGLQGSALADFASHRELYGIKTWKLQKAFRDAMGSILRVELVKA